jgi:hypothetical protein
MPQAEFKPLIPVFERAKIIYALDRSATVIGVYISQKYKFATSLVMLMIRQIYILKNEILIFLYFGHKR